MGAFPRLHGGVAEGCPGGSGPAGRCPGSAGAEPGRVQRAGADPNPSVPGAALEAAGCQSEEFSETSGLWLL